MENKMKNQNKSMPLAAKILAGFLAVLMIASVVFGLLYAIV